FFEHARSTNLSSSDLLRRTYSACRVRSGNVARSWRWRRNAPLLLLLSRRRRVGLRIAERHGLRHSRRAGALARRGRSRATKVIRQVNMRRDEEQDLATLARNGFPLEQIAYDRKA